MKLGPGARVPLLCRAARPGRKALQTLPEFEQIVEQIVVSRGSSRAETPERRCVWCCPVARALGVSGGRTTVHAPPSHRRRPRRPDGDGTDAH